jgi:hypothetical protein
MIEVMEMLVECIQEFKTRSQGQYSQSEYTEGICFVSATVSGLKMVALLDTGETHSFVSE